ncbi:extracellular solute-binding protein [Halomarina pelagica]|uniref:extracellular solute-binding protein n=1 Tax=Halomarina pelagica TaxID=2961599 RepID=UPI0020C5414F|nr:extracellular solute-binding protein [Halomarina sp. BND7]
MAEERSSAGKRSTTRRRVLAGVGAAAAVGLAGCTGLGGESPGGNASDGADDGSNGTNGTNDAGDGDGGGSGADSLTVFHAGSLAPPFSAAEPKFEEKYGVQVNREAKGSVGSTKKITEQGRKADVLGVSDFRLIRDMMLPKFADWYAVFATNSMTIAYTDDSVGADEVSSENWWEVLLRDDVRFAHSDPAVDPNGYRSVMAMQLGAIPFQGETLYDEATSKELIEKAAIPAGTETELIGQLEAGKLDYAWEYTSVEATHDLNTVDLQPSVDLSKATATYADHYAKATVEAGGTTYTGAPIAYGITVPSVAQAPDLGAKWVEYMVTEPGQEILRNSGFDPTSPAVVPKSAESNVPERVMSHAEAKESLGPLEL